MNWISDYVRPRISSLFARREIPENLWHNCKQCSTMLFHRELSDNLNVCPSCHYHMNIAPRTRFAALFDKGVFNVLDIENPSPDPLHFRDKKKYVDRIKADQKATDEKEAILVAEGNIGDVHSVVAAHDFRFMAGSLGCYVGNGFVLACQRAVERQSPLVVFAAAGGARMQEGVFALMQLPRTIVALKRLKAKRLPYIVVLTNPTSGGVTASYAMLGDVHLAEPGALICFAGPRVIEQTIREKLPPEFQRSEYLLERGMVDRVTHRKAIRDELITLIRLFLRKPAAIKGNLTVAKDVAPPTDAVPTTPTATKQSKKSARRKPRTTATTAKRPLHTKPIKPINRIKNHK